MDFLPQVLTIERRLTLYSPKILGKFRYLKTDFLYNYGRSNVTESYGSESRHVRIVL